MRLIVLLLLLAVSTGLRSQWMSINESGSQPNTSAALDISSTSKGVLIPRMTSSNRLTIPSPAQGLLVFQTNGTIGFYYFNGTVWDTLGGATSVVNISNVTNILNSGIAVIRDLKSAGADGGTFNSGSWIKRDLNDIDGDLTFVSLDTNSFTLDSGTYVITANAPAFEVDDHQIRLYNVSLGAEAGVGTVIYSNKFASSTSSLTKVINVTAAQETFQLQHRCTITKLSNGLGRGVSFGSNVFSAITIQKL